MVAADLSGNAAYETGWRYLDAGFHWEAHEVWEPVWMACAPNSAERQFVAGLIQIANSRLKAAMGRGQAARRASALARVHLNEAAARDHGKRVLREDLERARRALEYAL